MGISVRVIPGGFQEDDGCGEPEIVAGTEHGGVAAEQDDGRPGEGQRPKNFLVNLSVIATK